MRRSSCNNILTMNPLDTINTLGFTLSAFARPYRGRAHMERYQLRKLKKLVRHADSASQFCHEWFNRHGFDPQDIRKLSDIRKIPPMGKQQLRELRDTVSEEDISSRNLIEHKTSGSTGVPMHILRSPSEERRLNMLRWRLQWILGLRPGDRLAKVKTTWEPLSRQFNRPLELARSLRILDSRVFDCFENPAESYRRLVDFQPHILSGYPGALVKIALQHTRQGGSLNCLRRVSCGGESLAPHQRSLLEDSFGLPVFDVYGASECNVAAWQCPEIGQYHVNDDGIILEVCRDGIPVAEGESGEVLITSLHSRTMPIIRYAMGDLAIAGPAPCACGSPFSTIRALQGRTIDFLQLPDGRELHPFELLNEIVTASSDWIAEYQLIQEARDRFRVLLVPRRPVSEKEKDRFRTALWTKLGSETQLDLEFTEKIAPDASGKLHFCRSNVQAIPQRR